MANRRISIYFFYNNIGYVSDYVIHYLKEIKKLCAESCVVVNEILSNEGRAKLQGCCDTLLVRENVGFDSAAYKYAIKHYGYDYIKQNFDELILNNFTCYGPIYPLNEMFDEMEKRDCDLWGINAHPAMDAYLLPGVLDSKIVKHIQSFFIVFKRSILSDDCFKDYWETLKVPYSYQQAILFHELRCSNYFEKRGFKTDTFINFNKYKEYVLNHTIYLVDRMVKEDRLPIIKRKAFFIDNMQIMYNAWGHFARDLLEFIQKNTDYDVNLIWQDLIKTQKMSVLRNNLHLNYYLPADRLIDGHTSLGSAKVAVVIFVFFEDQIDYVLSYAGHMPSKTDIYIVAAFQSILDRYKESCSGKFGDKYKFYYRLMEENRGRDVSAYLVAAADVFGNYDFICLIHDKKSSQLPDRYMCDEFRYYCFENTLASSLYIENIICTFEKNPKLGMLVPPVLNFGPFFMVLSNELGNPDDQKLIKGLYKEFKISVPFDDHPVAPFGTMFWVRGSAFKTILKKKWKYSDFPKEPNKNDGTILHAIERFYPTSVQESGFYVGYVATSYFASIQNDNNLYYLSRLLEKLGRSHPNKNTLYELLGENL